MQARETVFFVHYPSPLGLYLVAGSPQGLFCIKNEAQAPPLLARWEHKGIEFRESARHNQRTVAQLDAYFSGKRLKFDLPLDLRGTPFQRRVWECLLDIPPGRTWTYGQVAEAIGRPGAARAVGRAVGTNPVAIVVPCHRVIGSDGSLTGYGGGLERKTALLQLEGITVD